MTKSTHDWKRWVHELAQQLKPENHLISDESSLQDQQLEMIQYIVDALQDTEDMEELLAQIAQLNLSSTRLLEPDQLISAKINPTHDALHDLFQSSMMGQLVKDVIKLHDEDS